MIQVCESGPGCILWVVTWSFLIGKNLFLFPRFVGDESGISPSTMSSDPSVFSLLKFPIGILIGNLYYFLLWLFIGYLLWLFIAQPIDYLFGLPIKYPINTLYTLVFPVWHCIWADKRKCLCKSILLVQDNVLAQPQFTCLAATSSCTQTQMMYQDDVVLSQLNQEKPKRNLTICSHDAWFTIGKKALIIK